MFHHDGLMIENKRYAKGFGVVYFEGGEPFISSFYTMKGCRINGIYYGDTTLTSINLISSNIPNKYSLFQNYPNPFNPVTKIKFDILGAVKGKTLDVKLIIYDITGREIQTLVNEKLNPGTYEVTFDGSNYASGVYFYQLRSGDFVETKKLVLLKYEK